jgi:Tfp pilus assembly protein PilZ
MTTDISDGGLRFETARIYSAGDSLLITMKHGDHARLGEMPARVVRIEAVKGGFEQRAAVRWIHPPESQD